MSTYVRQLFAPVALALVAIAAGCGGSSDKAGGDDPGDPLTLTYVTQNSEDAATRFAAAVDELSGGSMRIDVRENWRDGELAYEHGTVEDIGSGKADLGDVGVRVFDTMGVTSFQALVAPLLIDSVELQQAVLTSDIPAPMLDGLHELGVVGLGVVPGTLRRPAGKRALLSADDYRGRRIGVREGAVAQLAMRALGATPVLYAPGDLSGVDGAELDLQRVESWGHGEGIRSVAANIVLWPKPMAIVADDDMFESLTSEQQETLREAAAATVEPLANDNTESDADYALAACGIDRSLLRSAAAGDLASLRSALAPVYRTLESDRTTRAAIAEIRALRHTIEPEPSPTCSPSKEASAADVADQALGKWNASFTEDELLDAGLAPEEAAELAGKWTLEVTEGQWSSRHVPSSMTWEATWSVSDGVWIDTIVACTPPDACTTGATYEYEVTVYKDTMISKAIPGRPHDPFSVLKPWRRVR